MAAFYDTFTTNSAATTTATTWYNWNTTTSDTTWSTWGNSYYYYDYTWDRWNPPQNIAIHNADRTRERDYQEELKELRRKEQEAKEKAEQLLLENLTEEQQEMYLKLKKFHVISSEGKRFEIDCGGRKWHNVYELEGKKRRVEHCIYTPGVPLGDNYLAQKLLLETNEKEFVRIANQTRLLG